MEQIDSMANQNQQPARQQAAQVPQNFQNAQGAQAQKYQFEVYEHIDKAYLWSS